MRWLLLLLLLAGTHFCSGQEMKIGYWSVGLGSNWHQEEWEKERGCTDQLIIFIKDSVLSYVACDPTKNYKVDPEYGDTTFLWELQTFRRVIPDTLVAAIAQVVDSLKGKYLFLTNPYVRSGGIDNLIVEGSDWCTHLELKNTNYPAYEAVVQLINPYLEERHQIYISSWNKSDKSAQYPIVKTCPDSGNGSYREALGKEYDAIRQSTPGEK